MKRKILSVLVLLSVSAHAEVRGFSPKRLAACLRDLTRRVLGVSAPVRVHHEAPVSADYRELRDIVDRNYIPDRRGPPRGRIRISEMVPFIQELSDIERYILREHLSRLASNLETAQGRSGATDFSVLLALGHAPSWEHYVDVLAEFGCTKDELFYLIDGLHYLDRNVHDNLVAKIWLLRKAISNHRDDALVNHLSPQQSLEMLLRFSQLPVATFKNAVKNGRSVIEAFQAAYEQMAPPARVRPYLPELIPFMEISDAAVEWFTLLRDQAAAGAATRKFVVIDIAAPVRFEDLHFTYDEIPASTYLPPFRIIVSATKITLLIYPASARDETDYIRETLYPLPE